MSEYVPIEFMSPNYAIIFYLLNEKIKIENSIIEKKCFDIYDRLILTDLVQIVPINKLESWINDLFNLFETLDVSSRSSEIFDKLIKKSIHLMLKEQNIECFIKLIEKLFVKLESNDEKLVSIINLTFLQTLEKICKIQDQSNLKQTDESYCKNLNDLSEKLIDYFINLSMDRDSQTYENHSFYICSILMRHICSTNFKNLDNKKVLNNEKKMEYFKLMLEFCLKKHKKYVKKVKKLDDYILLSSFYIEFLRSYILNSYKLVSYHNFDVNPVKLCKQLLSLYLNFDGKIIKLDLTNETENKNTYLVKSIVSSINTLNVEEFKEILKSFESEINENFHSLIENKVLLKISELIRYACNELELNATLKPDFSEFLQKVYFEFCLVTIGKLQYFTLKLFLSS